MNVREYSVIYQIERFPQTDLRVVTDPKVRRLVVTDPNADPRQEAEAMLKTLCGPNDTPKVLGLIEKI